MDAIMRILNKNHYSPAGIRRDLTLLEKRGLMVQGCGADAEKRCCLLLAANRARCIQACCGGAFFSAWSSNHIDPNGMIPPRFHGKHPFPPLQTAGSPI